MVAGQPQPTPAETASLPERARERLARMGDLPSSAAALQRALMMLDEPLCTNLRLERVLTSDQGALTGLLRLANSAYFGVPGEVATAGTAIRVVGHRRLRALLCHLVAGKLFEVLRMEAPMVELVRRKALAAAAACSEIGEPTGDAGELRVAGLLHNIAELALAAEFPGELAAAERPEEAFGVRFDAAAAALLKGWSMPAGIVRAARDWRTAALDDSSAATQRAVDAVHVGATLAEVFASGGTEASAAGLVEEQPLRRLAVTDRRLRQIFASIPAGILELERTL